MVDFNSVYIESMGEIDPEDYTLNISSEDVTTATFDIGDVDFSLSYPPEELREILKELFGSVYSASTEKVRIARLVHDNGLEDHLDVIEIAQDIVEMGYESIETTDGYYVWRLDGGYEVICELETDSGYEHLYTFDVETLDVIEEEQKPHVFGKPYLESQTKTFRRNDGSPVVGPSVNWTSQR